MFDILSRRESNAWSGHARYVQAKLKISGPDDIYEQEADRVADRVTAAPMNTHPKGCSCGGNCPKCQSLQGRGVGPLQSQPITSDNMPGVSHTDPLSLPLSSTPRALPENTRQDFEKRFGRDFSQVRLHTDSQANRSARAFGARALTAGRDIVFASGEYSPESRRGQHLLAHELTHVVQQRADGDHGEPSSRVIQRQAGGQVQQGLPGEPEPMRYRGCSPFSLGLDLPLFMVNLMIQQALQSGLVRAEAALRAINAIQNGTASEDQTAALESHFGPNLESRHIEVLRVRYRRIVGRLRQMDQNDMIVCNTEQSVYCNGVAFRDRIGACAFTDCGTTSEATHLCPAAFHNQCGEDLPSIMIHEAARSAGVCANAVSEATRPDEAGYPPQHPLVAVQNVFAYEFFASDSRLHGL